MKTIVLIVLVAVAGCSKKGPDCSTSIAQGIEAATAKLGGHSATPQMMSSMVNAMLQLKTVVTKRCVEDRWPAVVIQCFSKAQDMNDLQACQNRLDQGLRDKLNADIREIRNAARQRMPDLPGHPQTLSPGSGSAASTEPGSPAPPAPAAPDGTAAPAPAPGGSAGTAPTPSGGTVVPAMPPAGGSAGSGGW